MNKRLLQLIMVLSTLAILAGLTLSLTYASGTRILFQVGETDAVPASSYPR